MPPNARFLPQKAPLILPRQSSRQRRETPQQRPTTARKWGKALVIAGIVAILFFLFSLGVIWGILPGTFVR